MKTQTIAGHSITLESGHRYRASRPFNERGRKVYPVSIQRIYEELDNRAAWLHTPPDVVVDGLSYDEASDLVNAFNDGTTSFRGRVW